MVNGKTPLYLSLVAAALLALALLAVQPYSGDWPGSGYTEPARRYVRAALERDSATLLRLSVSPAPVVWALGAARAHPEALGLWRGRVRAWTGERRGDTVEVFLYPPGEECGKSPIVFRFVDSGSRARVLRASSACLPPS